MSTPRTLLIAFVACVAVVAQAAGAMAQLPTPAPKVPPAATKPPPAATRPPPAAINPPPAAANPAPGVVKLPPVAAKPPMPDIMFFVAHGEPNACGHGCDEWIAAEGRIDVNAAQRLRKLLEKLGRH